MRLRVSLTHFASMWVGLLEDLSGMEYACLGVHVWTCMGVHVVPGHACCACCANCGCLVKQKATVLRWVCTPTHVQALVCGCVGVWGGLRTC